MSYCVVCRRSCKDVIGDGSTLVYVDGSSGDFNGVFVESEAPVAEPIAGNDVDRRSFAVTSRSPGSVDGCSGISSVGSILLGVPVAEPIAGNDVDKRSFAVTSRSPGSVNVTE